MQGSSLRTADANTFMVHSVYAVTFFAFLGAIIAAVVILLLARLKKMSPAAMEEEFLVAINSTGIGPMGLGGDTTALRVNIEYAYTHTPWNPIAVDIQCWPNRRSLARIHDDQKITYI